MNKKNEPHRHHYIPQFIIKNFGIDKMGFVTVNYYDIKRKKFLTMPTEDIFSFYDLYRDEINNADDSAKIEKDFAKYESEIARIFKEKILDAKERITLTTKEHDSILLFLCLMEMRSKYVPEIFTKQPKDILDNLKRIYKIEGDLIDFWRKNLGIIVNCRCLNDVLDNQEINDFFKNIVYRNTYGPYGRYLIFAERRGNEDFILSDTYPALLEVFNDDGDQLPLMSFCPISPSRIIISACKGVETCPQQTRIFDKSFFSRPFVSSNKEKIDFCIKKMYEKDVLAINTYMFESSTEGIAVYDVDRFSAYKK